MILEGEIKDAKLSSFFLWFPNTHLTLISFVFSLWIINEFEKTSEIKNRHSHKSACDYSWFNGNGAHASVEKNNKNLRQEQTMKVEGWF